VKSCHSADLKKNKKECNKYDLTTLLSVSLIETIIIIRPGGLLSVVPPVKNISAG
jgi:hypothetical protein